MSTSSYVRFLVSSPSEELKVVLSSFDDESLLIESSRGRGSEEAIVAKVPEGSYQLTISRRGAELSNIPCSVFFAVLSVTPSAAINIECARGSPHTPNFEFMAPSLENSPYIYHMEANPAFPYQYNYKESILQQDIFPLRFEIHQTSQLYVEVGVNFAVGDVSLYLTGINSHLIEGVHSGSAVFLFAELQPGTFDLTMASGTVQTSDIQPLSSFPGCLRYTLRLTILPIEKVKGCLHYLMLPDSLVSPSFLESSDIVSLHAPFQQPDGRHAIDLQVRQSSFLRSRISEYSTSSMLMQVVEQGSPEVLAVSSIS